jgi:CRISPR-associated exonuclease Cas4
VEENIAISNLNDFLFCPRSIYFHNLYYQLDKETYQSACQVRGTNAHKRIDDGTYSTKKKILAGLSVYSEELGLTGKIDIFDVKKKTLIERKNKIRKLYEGYLLQVYAQYYCLTEMGYQIKKIILRSLSDNKNYAVKLPSMTEKKRLKQVIAEMKSFDLEDANFTQNPNKCRKCIYRHLCDYYTDDE